MMVRLRLEIKVAGVWMMENAMEQPRWWYLFCIDEVRAVRVGLGRWIWKMRVRVNYSTQRDDDGNSNLQVCARGPRKGHWTSLEMQDKAGTGNGIWKRQRRPAIENDSV